MNFLKAKPTTFLCFIIVTLAFVQTCLAQNFPQDYLDAHNTARAAVGVENIVWNDTLAAYAQLYANSQAHNCDLEIEPSHGPYGENLAVSNSAIFSGVDAVELWLSEKVNYNYSSNTCAIGTKCFTYTQVVWRASLHVGCARVQCFNGWVLVVCSYSPPGNIVGQRPF